MKRIENCGKQTLKRKLRESTLCLERVHQWDDTNPDKLRFINLGERRIERIKNLIANKI